MKKTEEQSFRKSPKNLLFPLGHSLVGQTGLDREAGIQEKVGQGVKDFEEPGVARIK